MPTRDNPSYQGDAQAIHVEAFSTDPSVTEVVQPVGGQPNPSYQGKAQPITTNEDSPDQFHVETLTGPLWDTAVYRGMSPAIHVWGEDRPVTPPPPPIHSCKCCAETGSGDSGCTPDTIVFNDNFERAAGNGLFGQWVIPGGSAPHSASFYVDGQAHFLYDHTRNEATFPQIYVPMALPHASVFTFKFNIHDPMFAFGRGFTIWYGNNADVWELECLITGNAFDPSRFQLIQNNALGAAYPGLPFRTASFQGVSEVIGFFTPILANSWYSVKVQTDEKVVLAKIWAVGDPEPASWMIGLNGSGTAPDQTNLFLIPLYNRNIDWSQDFDDFKLIGTGDCVPEGGSADKFDSFNRDVATGAGVSDFGLPYTYVPSGGTNEDIEVFDEGDATGNGLYMGIGPAPSGDVSGNVHTGAGSGGPWVSSEWTWTGRFTFSLDSIVPSGATLAITNDGTVGMTVGGTGLSIGNLTDDANGFASVAWNTTAIYLFKLYYRSGVTVAAKVWIEGHAEPDWMVFGEPSDSIGPNAYLFLGAVSTIGVVGASGSAGSIFIDWIDFQQGTGNDSRVCTTDLLTADNLSTDWHVIGQTGDHSVVGNDIVVHIADSDPTPGSQLNIFRTIDIPRAQVLAGIVLDVEWSLTYASNPEPADGITIAAQMQITGSSSSTRSATARQDVIHNPSGDSWEFAPGTGASPTHINAADLVSGETNHFKMKISSGAGYSTFVEQGLNSTYSAPTLPAGDPLTVKITLNALLAPSDLDNPEMTIKIGKPILQDASGNNLDILGSQECTDGPARGDCDDSDNTGHTGGCSAGSWGFDDFDRVVANGWGSSPFAPNPYTHTGTNAMFAVNGSYGTQQPTLGQTNHLGTVTATIVGVPYAGAAFGELRFRMGVGTSVHDQPFTGTLGSTGLQQFVYAQFGSTGVNRVTLFESIQTNGTRLVTLELQIGGSLTARQQAVTGQLEAGHLYEVVVHWDGVNSWYAECAELFLNTLTASGYNTGGIGLLDRFTFSSGRTALGTLSVYPTDDPLFLFDLMYSRICTYQGCGFIDRFNRTQGVTTVTDADVVFSSAPDASWGIGPADTGQKWFDLTEVYADSTLGISNRFLEPPIHMSVSGGSAIFDLPAINAPARSTGNLPAVTQFRRMTMRNRTRDREPVFPLELNVEFSIGGGPLTGQQLVGVPDSGSHFIATTLVDSIQVYVGVIQAFQLVYGLVNFGDGGSRRWYVALNNGAAVFPFEPGNHFYGKCLMDGSTIYIKAWHPGEAEPAYFGPFSFPSTSWISQAASNTPNGTTVDVVVARNLGQTLTANGQVFNLPQGVVAEATQVRLDYISLVYPGRDCAPVGGGTGSGCTECEDPDNPGFQLPDFTPGYMPTFRRQIGDPTTSLDSFICTMESGAMVLDWHTRGAVKVWGGQLIPWSGRTEASIRASGTNLGDVKQAWTHWNSVLSNRSGGSWDDLFACLLEGRAVILQGDYDQFSAAVKCQAGFEDNHAISVYPYQIADRLLVGDPLCHDFHGVKISTLQNYAEDLGRVVFGTTSPQKILFAVSRPWTP